MKKVYTGINIQYPVSRWILEGKKTIETRCYPIPDHFIGQELLIIETPGKTEKFKARIIGKVVFAKSFQYRSSKEFYADEKKHLVTHDSVWAFRAQEPKHGWPIEKVIAFPKEIHAPKKKGIRYTSNISV